VSALVLALVAWNKEFEHSFLIILPFPSHQQATIPTSGINRNLLFDFTHGDNRTPISPVRDIVKRFSSGAPQQSEIRTSTAENCPIFRHFCNTYPSAHPFSPDSAADSGDLTDLLYQVDC
jgi:hypothetical protein